MSSPLLAIDVIVVVACREQRSSSSLFAIDALAIVALTIVVRRRPLFAIDVLRCRSSRSTFSCLQILGWLSCAPSHCSLFSIVASCDQWGGKIRLSSSRLLLSAVHPGALDRGQRPEKLPLIVACGLRIARPALFDHFFILLASKSCRVHRVHLLVLCGCRI